jgi:hypothetical protein
MHYPQHIASQIVMGFNDTFQLGEGWHERTIDPRSGIVYRITERQATFRLFRQPRHRQLKCLLAACPSLLGQPVLGRLRIENCLAGYVQLDTDNWVLRTFDINEFPEGELDCCFEIKTTFIPAKYLNNGDYRQLGIYVAALTLVE